MFQSGPYAYDAERGKLKIRYQVVGELAVGQFIAELRPANGKRQILTVKHMGQDRVWVCFGGAIDNDLWDNGFPLDSGQSLIWSVGFQNLWVGPIQVICSPGDSATLRWVEGTS
jgi:hypothetical protein